MKNKLKSFFRKRAKINGSFSLAWEQRKLGDCGLFKSNGVDKLSKPDEIPVNLLNYMDVYNKREITNKNACNLMQVTAKPNQLKDNNVLKGDVFFTPTSETADDIGHSKVIEENLNNTVYSYHLMRYRPHENTFYLTFPNFVFDNNNIYKQMSLLAQGVQRFVLSKSQFESISFSMPNIKEQEKISILLENLDNLITLHQRKYDKLLNVKKALLEKMFPKNGKNTPEIRFKGFTEAWEQRKVGEVSSLRGRIGFRGYTREDLVNSHEGAITFSPSDIDDEGHLSLANNDYISFEKYEESPEIKVEVGDILFTKTASIGKVAFVKELQEKATINPQFALISPNRKINNYFQFLSMRLKPFMKKVWDITGGSSIPTMSQEKLKELSFHVPLLEEQKNISDLFSNLDNLITLHQRE